MPVSPSRARATVWLAVLAAVLAAAAPAGAGVPAWTTYHRDGSRTGIDPSNGSPLSPAPAWQTPALDGQIYGQPLVYGSRVYVATENDSVYALDAATGAVLWRRSAGTPVPSTQLGCGSIDPTVGITSTPVLDLRTNRIYVVATNWDGSNVSHQLVSFDLSTGAPGTPREVDPPTGSPRDLLQRGSLALDGREIVIPYGGNNGDCGNYHGWLVGAQESGGGALLSYEAAAAPGDSRGAIWGGGNAPAIDASGNLYVATGNGDPAVSGDQESVVKLGPALNVLDSWRPSNWAALDNSDADLGSSEPLPLPGGYVFQTGKDSNGYLLHAAALGGSAAPVAQLQVCGGQEAKGGGVYAAGIIYVACDSGLHAVSFDPLTGAVGPDPAWHVTGGANGPPIIAAGRVWVAGYGSGTLYGLDPQSGTVTYSQNLGTVNDFSSPSAAAGRLFVADGNLVTALSIAAAPAPSATVTAVVSSANPTRVGRPVTFTATVSPIPDAGTVRFSGARGLSGCSAVALDPTTGSASCRAVLVAAGRPVVRASYSGDAYLAGSAASLTERVSALVPRPPVLSRVRLSRSTFTARNGTRLTLNLSAPATVTAVIAAQLPGHRAGRRCSTRTKRGRRCTVSVRRARLSYRARSGPTHHILRLRGLRPGDYRIVITATDAGGRSKPVSLRFRVRRR